MNDRIEDAAKAIAAAQGHAWVRSSEGAKDAFRLGALAARDCLVPPVDTPDNTAGITRAIMTDCLKTMRNGNFSPETRMFAQVIAKNLLAWGVLVSAEDETMINGAFRVG